MNAEDLLLSTKSLLELQKMQAEMEGRDFEVQDAFAAVRPALESVLGELLDLQRRGAVPDAVCPHCNEKLQLTIDDVVDNYETQDATDLLTDITSGTYAAADLKVMHDHEKQHQARGQILSALSQQYALESNGMKLDDAAKAEHNLETERHLDKMFDDLFSK